MYPRAQEALALNQLYKTLTLEMKCRCIDRDCHTVAEAVDVIERYEAVMDDSKDRKRTHVCMTNIATDDSIPKHSDNLEKCLQDIVQGLSKLDLKGHGARPQYNRGYQNNGQDQKAQRSFRRCLICNEPGHLLKSCTQGLRRP